MASPRLDNRAARRLFLDRHALAERPAGSARGGDLLDLVRRLGFVQVDSINTVARAHDLILFSRRPSYRPENLTPLLERDRSLFEHWTHDAAVIPTEFYPHWQLRFARDAEVLKERWRNWRRDGFEQKFASVLTHIRDHGPVSSADVGKDEARSNGGWWDWHPSKTALEYLWRIGALAVTGRDGFRKRYDLAERVIDETLCDVAVRPDPEETIGWCCDTALDRLGFATPGELAAFWGTVSVAEARDWCDRSARRGEIVGIAVESARGPDRRTYARPDVVERAAAVPPLSTARIRALSPFDPALRDRARAERLFGFRYRIEIFVPEAKRQYGYYVFPLIEGDRLAGRIDMKARRDDGRLRVRALWPEPGVRWSVARVRRLEAELDRLARLAGVGTVGFDNGWMRGPVTND